MTILVTLSLSKTTLSTQRPRQGKGNAPHRLPHETEHERPYPIDDVGALDPTKCIPFCFPSLTA